MCNKPIKEDELRIGKLIQFKERYITQYYHVNCAFDSFNKARVSANVICDQNELDGFDEIDDTDKCNIILLIENGNTSRNLSQLLLPSKQIGAMKTLPNTRWSQLKSSSLPAINVMFTNADQLTSLKMAELKKLIHQEKPLLIAVCELKPKNNNKDLQFMPFHVSNLVLLLCETYTPLVTNSSNYYIQRYSPKSWTSLLPK